ncbi:C-3',4' desaturase CrtD [Prochlorococcus marinus str. MU1404]|uniref:C-3',4' desaturase CrtD n=1 Tax=Prochlorococcus marinus TaxID=1219 RepID=UPI001ADAD66D|nr:C-3',4' desaturase CrtD [Prochlorococcus marinus]MBO8230865.1 C-3',4' desaturase CrtD [Prochlorococcus marinus XMU1404]MBW3073898.1 C-3',4' desaturase CrtD [Prochlorococcus marinus str. MU1404]MCR8544803.1 C-3',4' desaturase CrtD [Prochlorococcus marinus CUG1432]
MRKSEVVVVGAGIAGLTSAAILSKQGLSVTLIESHVQSGGCAGTFKRKNYIFDVGATQVAGLERGGIHSRIFDFLDIPSPEATILDPACIVDFNDDSKPIQIWHDKKKWIAEQEMQFPGSRNFWKLCSLIHQSNWIFANNNPVLPIRNFWDFSQLFKALVPSNLITGILLKSTIFDLLRICGLSKNKRLIKFLNLQLKLYSQEDVYSTAALYGSTVLQMCQKPHGLWHLTKSMQSLSEALESSLRKTGVNLIFGQKVDSINFDELNKCWKISAKSKKNSFVYQAKDLIYTAPPQALLKHFKEPLDRKQNYKKRLNNLPDPSGAIVFYSALKKEHIKKIFSNHYQFVSHEFGSLFVSISEDGDGRAPKGEVTLIASIFTETKDWFNLDKQSYLKRKNDCLEKISLELESYFDIDSENWLHRELATPLGFQKWTNRPNGIVGGLGQNPDLFGLFGLSSRTPFEGLWLCGDSIYPGEGTAGVSQSALMVSRQILASKGIVNFNL